MTALVVVTLLLGVLLLPARQRSLAGARPASNVVHPSREASWSAPRAVAVLAAGSALGLTLAAGGASYAVPLVLGLASAAIIRTLARRHRREGQARGRQRAAIVLCDRLAAELRAGLPAVVALERSCSDLRELVPVVTAARLGGDVAGAFRACAAVPGAEGLRAVGACWGVAAGSGVQLADVLQRIAAALRAEQEADDEVVTALAPPRATARLLAVLPVFGLALGTATGARPLGFLLGTPWGNGLLAAGVALALTGVLWVEALAARATR